jgi:phosphomannomutase/phosphoglucomutase
MKTPSHVFREYDIRGEVETDLTSEFVRCLGRGLGTAFQRAGATRIGVARDVRPSGEMLFEWLADGLMQAGCVVVDFGAAPTGVFYHAIATGEEEAGVCITGSHNPPEFNGFKIVLHGRSFYGDQIRDLRVLMEKEDFESGEGSRESRGIIEPYLDDAVSRVKITRPIRFAYDCGNGAASLVASTLFERLQLEPIGLFDEPDGTFPNHHPDPTMPENLEDLRECVLAEKLELGIAYDGDADRIGVLDEKGNVLWGDRLLMLYGRDLLQRHPGGGIIFDVKCSQTLIDEISAKGGTPILWKTGHSLIKEKMRESGALLAGEMSGHVFFAENWYGFDDALFATLRLLEIVSRDEEPLSSRLADVPTLVATPEIRVDCPDDLKFAVVAKVKEHFERNHEVNDIDGARVTFASGWGLVRASNTQPALVLRTEASDEAHKQDYLKQLQDAIAKAQDELVHGT